MRFLKAFIIILSLSIIYSAAYSSGGGGGGSSGGGEAAPASGEPKDDGGSAAQGGEIRLGGRSFGAGTEAKFFDDNLLISTPTPIATPIYKVSKEENEAWTLTRDTRDLIIRCRKDLRRYENFMRENFNKDYNKLSSAITSMHTYALLYKRDRVEHEWSGLVDETEKNLMTYEEFAAEFQRDVKEMDAKLKRAKELLDKSSSKMQKPLEIRREYDLNKEDTYFIKKGVEYFTNLYHQYFDRYEEITSKREARVDKLLREHRELHRP